MIYLFIIKSKELFKYYIFHMAMSLTKKLLRDVILFEPFCLVKILGPNLSLFMFTFMEVLTPNWNHVQAVSSMSGS